MSRFVTKKGAYGALYRYAITYTDRYDQCCPHMVQCVWAYNLEHAEERFYETDAEGWTIVSLARVLDRASQHEAIEHEPRRS